MPSLAETIAQSAADWPELYPDTEKSDTRRIADAALEGKVMFYGRRPVDVGRREIDWTGRHIHHQEWRAQLNRFFHLQSIRTAYRETDDEKYAACARDYIEDWIDQHHDPYDIASPECPHGDNSLNMSIRMGGLRFPGWLGVTPGLVGSRAFDEKFLDKMLQSMLWQLDWLRVNLKPQANWRIASLDALMSNALRIPEKFGHHLQFAVENLNAELAGQFTPDGVHIERSGGYHDWMCEVYVKLWRLSRRRPDTGLKIDGEKVARIHSYSLQRIKPNSAGCAFNDASSQFHTKENASELLDKAVSEHKELLTEADLPSDVPNLAVFGQAGHVFYRTGWSVNDTWWAFDAAGYAYGGHTHLSRLSVELHNGRRTTVPDPGIFDYEMSNPFAPAGKSTPMHSTMNINLGNQTMAEGRLVRAAELDGAVVVQGRYEGGYWPEQFTWAFDDGLGKGWFGIHDRTVVWLKNRAMIVLDHITRDSGQPAYLHWVSDDVPVKLDEDGMGMTTADEGGNVRIKVVTLSKCAAAGAIRTGEKDPYLGWIKRDDDIVPAPLYQVRFDNEPTRGIPAITECASVIVPFQGQDAPQVQASATTHDRLAKEVRIDWADGSTDRIIYTRQLAFAIRDAGDVHSDAAMVLIHDPASGEQTVEMLDGSFVRIGK